MHYPVRWLRCRTPSKLRSVGLSFGPAATHPWVALVPTRAGLSQHRTQLRAYPRPVLHAEIRTAVRRQLVRVHGRPPRTLLRDELGLCLGATRVDVAAINGQLSGCEIKGAQDKLSRLPRQVELYSQVLDEAVLVVEPKYTARAQSYVPDWWGVWQVEPAGRRVVLTEVRPAGVNPGSDPLAVAQLLWRDEAFEELQQRDATRGLAKATRWRLWEALVGLLTPDELGAVVRARLKARRDW